MHPSPHAHSTFLSNNILSVQLGTVLQVSAIDFCAREPMGRDQCQKIQGELGEEASSGKLGKFFFNS